MADHRIETKLLLRYATYSQWMNSELILMPGEAAVAIFRYSNNIGLSNTTPENTPPAVGLKIGDGVHYFYELPWVQAVAADVYEWAKAENKPTYTANEISGLADFIAAQGGGSGGGSGGNSGTSSAYRIVYDNVTKKYILQSYNESTGEWEDTSSNIDLSSILNRIDTIERWANGARTKLGNIELPMAEYIYEEVINYLNTVDYNDVAIEHQFVTQVVQENGQITVTRSVISASDITSGVLSTERGGTGLTSVDEDEVLIGSMDGSISKKKFVTEIENARNVFATVGAIKDYVDEKTAGITGAMHFIGEASTAITNNSRIDPQIAGYNFREVKPGDVILSNAQEFVWSGSEWHLLGDESSYAIKGSIVNTDISDNAAIDQSKIADLTDTLNEKVDKVEGKQLSTNDYTAEDKEKLDEIEAGAQVNFIEHILVNDTEVIPNNEKTINLLIPILTEEQLAALSTLEPNFINHIFVNGTELNPTTINNLTKSVNIEFTPFTQEEKEKLANIEAGAEVNKIEVININGTDYTPNNNKEVSITIDQAALNLNVLEGARYPSGANTYTDIDIVNKKLELSKIAATGNINDLIQTSGYVIFNCGSSTEVI